MITQQLIDYIKSQLAEGKTEADLRQILKTSAGWSDEDLSVAFAQAIGQQSVPPVPQAPVYQPQDNLTQQTSTVIPQVSQVNNLAVKSSNHSNVIVITVLLTLLVGAGLAYGYVGGYFGFNGKTVSNETFFENLYLNSQKITSNTTQANLVIRTAKREADAVPYVNESDSTSIGEAISGVNDVLYSAPSDFNANLSVTTRGNISTENKTVGDMEFQLKAGLDMNGASFKVDFESLLSDQKLFFIINEYPYLEQLSMLSPLRGKWIFADMNDLEQSSDPDDYAFIESMLKDIAKALNSVRTEKTEISQSNDSIKNMEVAKRVDSIKLFAIEKVTNNSSVQGENLTKYSLKLKFENIPDFYDMLNELSVGGMTTLEVDALKDEFNSPEAKILSDYLNKNMFVELWLDGEGYARQGQIRLRFVPSDELTHFADKQLELIISFTMSDINKPFVPQEPTTFMSVKDADKLISDYMKKQMEATKRLGN